MNNSITCKFDVEVGLVWILETHDAEEITILGDNRAPKHNGDVAVKIEKIVLTANNYSRCPRDYLDDGD